MKNVSKFKNPLLFISTLLAFVFYLSACTRNNNTQQNENKTFKICYGGELKLIEIDSCQYFLGEWGNATVLTHKGNCSHCRSRPK